MNIITFRFVLLRFVTILRTISFLNGYMALMTAVVRTPTFLIVSASKETGTRILWASPVTCAR